jgi:hypothetical protein
LVELATGFWSFKTLAAAYELGLFEQLSGTSGTTAGELAGRLGIASRPAEMLLTGCAALGLLHNQHGRYVNSPLSDEYLVPGKPNHFGGLVTMFDRRLYAGWDKLTQAIRTNRPTTWDPDHQRSIFDNTDPDMLATFWEAMHARSTQTGQALGAAFDLGGFRRLLDVGGGSGAFDIVLCQRYPPAPRHCLRLGVRGRHRRGQRERRRFGRSHRGEGRRLLRGCQLPRRP